MLCSNCGKQLPENAEFCSFCGNKINASVQIKVGETKEKTSKKWLPVAIVVLILVLVCVGIGVGYHFVIDNVVSEYDQTMSRAAELIEQKDYNGAIECYKMALYYKTDDADALKKMSNAYMKLADKYKQDSDFRNAYKYYVNSYKTVDNREAKEKAWECCYIEAKVCYALNERIEFDAWVQIADELAKELGYDDFMTQYTKEKGIEKVPDTKTEIGEDELEISPPIPIPSEDKIINLWAFADEVPQIINEYVKTHPEFDYEIRTTIIPTLDGVYQSALEYALADDYDMPDIYCVEAAFALRYIKGDVGKYAATYKDLGIDVETKIKEAGIADYSVQIGTRPYDNQVVGLAYQGEGGAFIYRRSIALDTWGTDDPAIIAEKIGGGSGNWDRFLVAAEELKEKGYAIISGDGDIWRPIENSADNGWVVDGKLYIDPKREAFLDIAKTLYDNDYTNKTQDWSDEWFDDMAGKGEKDVFGFFGPTWLINYSLTPNSGETYGDWAVCDAPVGFFWGGTWIMAHKDSDKKEAIGDILEWLTLDATENGMQYLWANDNISYYPFEYVQAVTSSEVMEISDGSLDFLGGQNMHDVYERANAYAKGDNVTAYDETINIYWRDAVKSYVEGLVDREEAIRYFKQMVHDNVYIEVK